MPPTIDRRSFIGSLGAAAIAGSLPRPLSFLIGVDTPAERSLRVAVFWEPGFPTVDGPLIAEQTLHESLNGFETAWLSASGLERLVGDGFDVFLNPYGSAFPKSAWQAILDFLSAGGSWVNIGGVPCAVPVTPDGREWRAEVRQTAYHKKLGITQAFPVDVGGLTGYVVDPSIVAPRDALAELAVTTTYALYYRFTRHKEIPEEDGSDGPREAQLTPLVSIYGDGEHPAAVPIVRIDRLQGQFAGGRWILANCDGRLPPDLIRALALDASIGAQRLSIAPLPRLLSGRRDASGHGGAEGPRLTRIRLARQSRPRARRARPPYR